jgi:outer membrane lipoprotein carrier protein
MLGTATCVFGAVLALAATLAPNMQAAAPAPSRDAKQAPTAREVERAFEARYRSASTLEAVFYERYSDGKGTSEAESGTVYFSRPGRMRWEYESPQKKLFIVDGTNVWSYIPDDHTASRTKLKQSSDWRTPIALLAEKADLGKICKNVELVDSAKSKSQSTRTQSKEGSGVKEKNSVLRCTPRGSSDEAGQSITDVLLTISPAGYLVRVLIRQPGELATEFRFGNWQENIPIAESQFHFQPPPGVEIVDEDKLAGQAY